MKIFSKILMMVFIVTACTKEQANKNANEQVENENISLHTEQIEAARLKTHKVEKQLLTQKVHVNGYLETPPNQKAEVSTFVTGYISTIKVLIGEKVQKGQVLAVLKSPEYLKLQQEYLELKSQLNYAKETYERNKLLSEEKISARKDFIKSEADYFSLKARLAASSQTLTLLGARLDHLDKGKVSNHLYIVSPIQGEVSEVHTVIGQYVEPTRPIFQIVDKEHLHLELKIFENDLKAVSIGQKVEFSIPQMSDQKFEAIIYLISNVIDDKERYVRVHAHINEEKASFKIGYYVEADIITYQKEVSAVPEHSIITIDNKDFIYVVISKDSKGFQFRPVEIKTAAKGQGWVEVSNIEDGTEYVTKGAYYLSTI